MNKKSNDRQFDSGGLRYGRMCGVAIKYVMIFG